MPFDAAIPPAGVAMLALRARPLSTARSATGSPAADVSELTL